MTVAEEIRDRVANGYDGAIYDAIHREMCYVYGIKNTGIGMATGLVKLYPDVAAEGKEIGVVQKTMRNANVFFSRLMSSEPRPSWEGVNEIQKAIRDAYWVKRLRGDGDSFGGLHTAIGEAWKAGWMHGYAGVHLGLATARKSKRQKLVGKFADPRYTVIDDLCRDPRDADWACFFEVMPVYQAKAMFEPELVDKRKISLTPLGNGGQREAVIVGTYYDVGLGDEEPRMAHFLGGALDKPVNVRPNVFGRIPCAWMVNTLLSGMRRPIGQVVLMQAAEEMTNHMMRLIRDKAGTSSGYTAINMTAFTPESQAKIRQSKFDSPLEMAATYDASKPPIIHVSGTPIEPAAFTLLNLMTQELNEQGGLSEIQRGGQSAKEQTKYEVAVLEQAAKANQSGPEFGTRTFLHSTMKIAFEIARDFDRDPFVANVLGKQVQFNVEGQASSSMGVVLGVEADLFVDETSLMGGDKMRTVARKLNMYQMLTPYVGRGIEPKEFITRILAAMGEPDADALLMGGEATDAAGASEEELAAVMGQAQGEQNGQAS